MLYYQSYGSGNNIVLIHGFCENSTCFNEQVLLLKDHYKVTVVDLPGAGRSAYAGELTIEKMADMVHEALVHAGLGDYVMTGHSMGGYITLAYARRYASSLRGFGLLHSTANADNEERRKKRDQAIAVIREKGFESYVRNFVPPMFAPSFSDQEIIGRAIEEALVTSGDALIAFLSAMKERSDSNAFLKETGLPVLFIAGKEDTLIPADDMIAQAATVRSGKLVQLGHSGHMGMIEEAKLCADGIRSFADHCFS